MKIEFLTQEDSLYVLPFFEEFLRHYASEFEITRISCCRAMGKRSRVQLLQELKWLYGVTGLGKLLLHAAKAKLFSLLPRSRSSQNFYSIAQLARKFSSGNSDGPCARKLLYISPSRRSARVPAARFARYLNARTIHGKPV